MFYNNNNNYIREVIIANFGDTPPQTAVIHIQYFNRCVAWIQIVTPQSVKCSPNVIVCQRSMLVFSI